MKWFSGFALVLLAWLNAVAAWIAIGPPEDTVAKAETAIVLGAAVDGDTPSPVFTARIDHAVSLYRKGHITRIVFTGGRSPEDTLSEAAAARDYAIGNGVFSGAIAIEEKSRTTRQNLVEASAVMGHARDRPVLIISDPLHLRRAVQMAEDMGFDATASATPSTRYRSWSTKLPFLMREVYFVHHYWLFGE